MKTINSSLGEAGLLLLSEKLDFRSRRWWEFRQCVVILLPLILVWICVEANVGVGAQQARSTEDFRVSLLAATDDDSVVMLLRKNRIKVTRMLWHKMIVQAYDKFRNKDFAESVRLHEIATMISKEMGDKALQAESHYRLGQAQFAYHRVDSAVESFLQSKLLFERMGALKDLTPVLGDLGTVFLVKMDYDKAEEYTLQSLRLARAPGTNKTISGISLEYGIATAERNLGEIALWRGDYERSRASFERSLDIWKRLDPDSQTYANHITSGLVSCGIIYKRMGDYSRALRVWRQASELAKAKGDVARLAGILNSIGTLTMDQRNYSSSSDSLFSALRLFTDLEDGREIANTLVNIGLLNQRQDKFTDATRYFEQSIKRAREAHAPDVMVIALEGLGRVSLEQQRYETALQYLDEAKALADQIGDQVRRGEIEWLKGEVCFSKADLRRALQHALSAVDHSSKLHAPLASYYSRNLLGKVQRSLNDVAASKQSFQSAIDAVEKLRDNIAGGEREQQLFFEDKLAPYHAMVEIYAEQHEEWRALEFAEMAKARVLFDVLSNGRSLPNNELSKAEIDQEHQLYVSMTALNSRLRALRMRDVVDQKVAAELEEQLSAARQAYEAFEMDMYVAHPRFRVQRGRLEQFSRETSSGLFTDRDLAILNYVVTENGTLMFVLTKETDGPSLDAISIPLKANELSALVTTYQGLLAKNHPGYHEAGRKLYELLIKPAEKVIAEAHTICIIPDASLWNLSFQALENPLQQYVIEKYALFYAPSLQVLAQMSRSVRGRSMYLPRDKQKEFYAIGNPALDGEALRRVEVERGNPFVPLPEAEREVNTISSQVYGSRASKVRIGKAALEESIKAEMKDYRVIHFATHGVFDDRNPLYSYLVLAPGGDSNEDGLLEAWELMKMNLKAELAVLSACDTARGRVGLGEGIIGLTWALFVAGVPTTIASQWQVPSEHTTRLMVAFHKARASRLDSPVSNAQAWRSAALSMIRNPRFRNKPYYWAGLVVIGNGNQSGANRRARFN